jgi:hypothetical protein
MITDVQLVTDPDADPVPAVRSRLRTSPRALRSVPDPIPPLPISRSCERPSRMVWGGPGRSDARGPLPRPSASSLCACGTALPPQRRGRRRRSCSPACKRRRDQVLRKIERRRGWIALWLVGGHDQAQVTAEVAHLEGDIRELLATVGD